MRRTRYFWPWWSVVMLAATLLMAHAVTYASIPVSLLTVVDTIPVGVYPTSMALTPDGNRLYVVNTGVEDTANQGSVSVIDTGTNLVVATIPFGVGAPFEIAITPDGSRAYVAVSKAWGSTFTTGSNRVEVINTSSNTIVATIPIGGNAYGPIGIAITPDGSHVYVTHRGSDRVEVISTATNTVVTSVPLGTGTRPVGIAITPDGSRAYVANRANSTVSVIDTETKGVIATIPVSIASTTSWTSVAITPDGSRAYVIYSHNSSSQVAVIDTDPTSSTLNKQVALIATTGSSLLQLTVVSDGSLIFVTNWATDEMIIIDADSTSPQFDTQVGRVQVGDAPWDVVFKDSSVAVAYVTNHIDDGTVSVIGLSELLITTNSPLPNGTVGIPYSAALEAAQGTPPYIWSIVAGALPPGLSLDSATGLISGTPTAADTYNFMVQVADSATEVASKQFELIVQVPPLIITTNSPLPSGTLDVPYLVTLEATGGVPPYTWSIAAGTLPTGLGLDPNTGVISGVPSAAGTFGFTVQVTDSSLNTATKPLAVDQPPSSGTAGTDYTVPINIDPNPGDGGSSGASCSNYSVVSGSLPAGLTLDPVTGVVSGTPTDGGTYDFTLGCTIDSGPSTGQTATKDFTITINNPLPTLNSLDPNSATAGDGAFILIVDGTNFVQSSVVQWNGLDRPTTYVSATQLTAQITAADIANAGTASITVVNPQPVGGTSNTLPFTIELPNQPPLVDAGGSYSGNEGSAIPLTGASATDPDGDMLNLNWSVNSGLCTFDNATALNPNLTCTDNGSYVATLTVSDEVNDPVSSDASISVANVDPTIDAVVAVVDPVAMDDQPVSVEVVFSDPGTADTHDVKWDWGDQSGDTRTDATSPASHVHTYAQAGIYTVQVTVTDDDGGSDTEVYEFIVIYNRDGGFVSGGGWFHSPAGAYVPDPTLTARANFGFVSRYTKGATIPTGNTAFQFRAGDLNFHSDSYEWLVVSQGGTNAQFKGSGIINGELAPNGETYKFMIWASDRDPDDDTFRIRIWYEDSSSEIDVYDNGFDQSIEGGNIRVHEG